MLNSEKSIYLTYQFLKPILKLDILIKIYSFKKFSLAVKEF